MTDLRIGVWTEVFDRTRGDEDGDSDPLPERKEQDSFDAQKLGGRSEGLDAIPINQRLSDTFFQRKNRSNENNGLVMDRDPKHSQAAV